MGEVENEPEPCDQPRRRPPREAGGLSPRRPRLIGGLAAISIFCVVVCAAAAALPYALGLLYGCVPPQGSCGDGVGWAMLISAPLTVPLVILVAGALAVAMYLRILRRGQPS